MIRNTCLHPGTDNPGYLFARVISDLANPLFIPPAVFLSAGWLMNATAAELSWVTGLAVLFYTMIPLGSVIYMLKMEHIESRDIRRREQRTRLFRYSIASLITGSIFLGGLSYSSNPIFILIATVFTVNAVASYFINFKWKISIHAASIGAAGTIFLVLFWNQMGTDNISAGIFSFLTLLLLLPSIMWARYHLNVHTVPELMGGAGAGICLTLLELGIMIQFW